MDLFLRANLAFANVLILLVLQLDKYILGVSVLHLLFLLETAQKVSILKVLECL